MTMAPVIVGSYAAKHWFPDWRDPQDVDLFTNMPGVKSAYREATGLRVETFYDPRLENWAWWGEYASPTELYTLKVSHMFWPKSWVKHAKDVIEFQKRGVNFDQHLFDMLYPIWEEHWGKKKASLKKGTTADDFFLASTPRVYDHDSVHASIAYYDEPLFNAVLQDGEAVAVSWKKFEALDEHVKMQLVREEIYATALERHVIPSGYRMNATAAYRRALQQTATSFWKGRWALWVVLHLDTLVNPDVDYVQVHHDNSDRLIKL